MSIFRSAGMRTVSSKMAHNNMMQGLVGNKELKDLQELITAEKGVLFSLQRLIADFAKASDCLKAWGVGEGDDLGDIFMHSNTLLQLICTALTQFATHEDTIRTYMKAVRTREEQLDELRRRRRGVAVKLDAAEKRLSKMSEEHKHLEAQKAMLQQLRAELSQLDREIINEEAAISDYKRTTSKDWMLLKFGGLLEVADKAALIGKTGMALIQEIPLEITTPPYGRVPYGGHQRTEGLVSECVRTVNEIVFVPTTSVAYHPPTLGGPPRAPPQSQYQYHNPVVTPPLGNQLQQNGGPGTFALTHQDTWRSVAPPYSTVSSSGGLPVGPMPHRDPTPRLPSNNSTYPGGTSPDQDDPYGEFGQFLGPNQPPAQSQTFGIGSGVNGPPRTSSFRTDQEQDGVNKFATVPRGGSGGGHLRDGGSTLANAADVLSGDPAFNQPTAPPNFGASPPLPALPVNDIQHPVENPWNASSPGTPVPAQPSVTMDAPRPTEGASAPSHTRQMSDASSLVLAYYTAQGEANGSRPVSDVLPSPKAPMGPRDIATKRNGEGDTQADDGYFGRSQISPTRPAFKTEDSSNTSPTAKRTSYNPEDIREANSAAAREISRELDLLNFSAATGGTVNSSPPPRSSSRQPRQQTLPTNTQIGFSSEAPASAPAQKSDSKFDLTLSTPPSLSLSFAMESFNPDFSSIQFSPSNSRSQTLQSAAPAYQSPVFSPAGPAAPPYQSRTSQESENSSKTSARPNIPMASFDPDIIPTAGGQQRSTSPVSMERSLSAQPSSTSLRSTSAESVLPPPPIPPFLTINSNTARTTSAMPGSPTLGMESPVAGSPGTISAAAFKRRASPSSQQTLDIGNPTGVGVGGMGVPGLQIRKKVMPPLGSNPSFASDSTQFASAPSSPPIPGLSVTDGSRENLSGTGGSGYATSPLALPGNEQRYASPSSSVNHATLANESPGPSPMDGGWNSQSPGFYSPSNPAGYAQDRPYSGGDIGVAVGSPSMAYDPYQPFSAPGGANRVTIGDRGWAPMQHFPPDNEQAYQEQQRQQQQQQSGRGGYESGRFATSLQ